MIDVVHCIISGSYGEKRRKAAIGESIAQSTYQIDLDTFSHDVRIHLN